MSKDEYVSNVYKQTLLFAKQMNELLRSSLLNFQGRAPGSTVQ